MIRDAFARVRCEMYVASTRCVCSTQDDDENKMNDYASRLARSSEKTRADETNQSSTLSARFLRTNTTDRRPR